ncbi:MAG: hypothetical protein IJ524_02590 [Bacteroidales bacterium]|nr:hypothetical protein [Bacteroidales bacterium]
MNKIKNILLRKILSYDESPAECIYGPPEWYDEDGRLKRRKDRYGIPEEKDILPEPDFFAKEKDNKNKSTDNDRI